MSSIELENRHTNGHIAGKHESVYIHVDETGKVVDSGYEGKHASSSSSSSPSPRADGGDIDSPKHPRKHVSTVELIRRPLVLNGVTERTPASTWLTAAETLHVIINGGTARAARNTWNTLCLSFMAGVLISFGGNMGMYISATLDASYSSFSKIGWALVFPFGLMLIYMHQAELFTGNVLYMLSAVFNKTCTWWGLIKNWIVVLIGNYAGTVVFAFFIAYLTEMWGTTDNPTALYVYLQNKVLVAKVNYGWGAVLLKAVACNFLVCTSVWWFNSSQDLTGKLIGVWWPIMCFVVSGYEHSIANMFYLMTGLMVTNAETWGTIFAWNIIPVIVGNIIGGVIFTVFQFMAHGYEAKVADKTPLAKTICLPNPEEPAIHSTPTN